MTEPLAADAAASPSVFSRTPFKVLVGVAVAAVAWFALHALAREITWPKLVAALVATPRIDIALAILLTALSFVALATYDVIAVRVAAPGRVPLAIAALTGAAGYAVSNMLGFAVLTGGALRARVYGRLGLEPGAVASVLGTSWITFWLGVAVATGAALVLDPSGPLSVVGLGTAADRWLGAVLLASVLAAFAWIGTGQRSLRWRSHTLRLSSLRLALAQTAVALLDVSAASLALWVLLPASVEVGPAAFFIAYVAAIVVGIVSHSPGGLGAFEATLMALLGVGGQSDVLAALILYRLIYYVLPFCVTAIGLAIASTRGSQEGFSRRLGVAGDVLEPFVPPVAAALALFAGTVLLFSGALPAIRPRETALEALAPLALVETSHIVGSAFGVVLVILARGLMRREARAWAMTLAALAIGVLASLLKGLDWAEAILLTTAAGLLIVFRDAFYRRGEPLRVTWQWLAGAALLLGASVWLGLLAYRSVDYANDLWWRFAWNDDAPRFLRASAVAAVTLLAIGARSLLRRAPPVDLPEPIPDPVRGIALTSADTEAALALLGDKRFLVSPGGDAFLMYRTTPAAMIAKGEPHGDRDAGDALAWEFLERADRAGLIPAFYAVGTDRLPLFLDMGLSILKIGEVARVDLHAFSFEGKARKDLRYARSRAERDGLSFGVLPVEEVPSAMDELRAVSDAWLAEKAGAEKSFALGGFDADYLTNFPVAVMRDAQGRIRAFANLWPGDGRTELSLDLMRYDPEAPGQTMNALFGELTAWGQSQGYRWFSLGAAPFSGMSGHRLGSRWNRVGSFVYEHGERFYHFEGLHDFKEKFDPVWTPNYLACPRGLAAARVLIEVNRLVSGGAKGLLR